MGRKFQLRFHYGTYGAKHEFGFLLDYKEITSPKGSIN